MAGVSTLESPFRSSFKKFERDLHSPFEDACGVVVDTSELGFRTHENSYALVSVIQPILWFCCAGL